MASIVGLRRRDFLYASVGGSTLLFGCGDSGGGDGTADTGATTSGTTSDGTTTDTTGSSEETGSETGPGGGCSDPFAGGELMGALAFVGEQQNAVGQLQGQGLDGRLAFDLGTLTEDTLVTPNDDFFVRTMLPDLLDPDAPWSIDVSGFVDQNVQLSLADLAALEHKTELVLLECSGNSRNRAFGLISAAEWTGVPVVTVLEQVPAQPRGTRVLISGFDEHSQPSAQSTPGASWVFTFDQLADAGAFLATEMNGEPLPEHHGKPVRLVIPGWYGCCNIKWVNEIRLVDDLEPATSQMQEFAIRTHQTAVHALAADYDPATMQQAAMPVRVEKWRVRGQLLYRVVGILWGGAEPTDALAIRFDGGMAQPVEVCPAHENNRTWTLWSYAWKPRAPGNVEIAMEISDPVIPTNRLDSGYYNRTVSVDEV